MKPNGHLRPTKDKVGFQLLQKQTSHQLRHYVASGLLCHFERIWLLLGNLSVRKQECPVCRLGHSLRRWWNVPHHKGSLVSRKWRWFLRNRCRRAGMYHLSYYGKNVLVLPHWYLILHYRLPIRWIQCPAIRRCWNRRRICCRRIGEQRVCQIQEWMGR